MEGASSLFDNTVRMGQPGWEAELQTAFDGSLSELRELGQLLLREEAS
jgi:hypothetical protein